MKELSIRQYAIFSSATILCIFIIFGWYTFHQIELAKASLDEWKLKTISEELNDAITQMTTQGTKAVQKFSEWQEVRQHILNPAFYSYWRDQRMMNGNFLTVDAITANVYNINGQSLVSISDVELPLEINPENLPEPYVTWNNDGKSHMAFFTSVYSEGKQKVIGFVSISLPFISRLSNSRFHHIDENTIYIKPFSIQIPILEISKYIGYEKRQDIAELTVKTILTDAIQGLLIVSLIITLLLYFMFVFIVGSPLQDIIKHIHRLMKNPDLLHTARFVKRLPVRELNEVGIALNAYQEELNIVYSSLDDKNKELWSLANTDPLTETKNRRAFNAHWKYVCEVAINSRMYICMVLFDINHFKAINDSYGHQVGDDVLKTIANLVNTQLRKGDHLYRLGGDEFGTVIINCSKEIGSEICNRCLISVNQFDFKSFGIQENVKISIGIACTESGKKEDLDNLSWQADAAVYQAKRPVNKNFVLYQSEMADSSRSLFSSWIYSAIFDAIEAGKGLTLFYQPIINLKKGTISYYESLVRIKHKNELIPPSDIFPIISVRDLDKEMDQAIVKAIQNDLENNKIPTGTGISINLSGPSVVSDDLVNWLAPLRKYQDKYKLVFEVTETSLISQMSRATENLNKLKTMGFFVALDDFGSGYSSLRYLGSMPVDIVKFDISLINELKNPQKSSLIYNLCHMINEIGYEIVAEGIEDKNTHKQIILAGFHYGQGYHFGKPNEDFDVSY